MYSYLLKNKNKKGFTIVELVIVIAVIAILAAVLIPTFSNVIEKANQSAALSDAKNGMTQDLVWANGDYSNFRTSGTDGYILLTTNPGDMATNYANYYSLDNSNYSVLSVAPSGGWVNNTYYVKANGTYTNDIYTNTANKYFFTVSTGVWSAPTED